MVKQIQQVKDFHKKLGIDMQPFELRHAMVSEEVKETLDAFLMKDKVEMLDGLVDTLYIVIGTAVQYGLSDYLVEAFDEVHRSNMTKLDKNGNPVVRDDGKITKSNLYEPPNLRKIMNKE